MPWDKALWKLPSLWNSRGIPQALGNRPAISTSSHRAYYRVFSRQLRNTFTVSI